MAWKRHSDEDILKLLREIELHLAGGCGCRDGVPGGRRERRDLQHLAQGVRRHGPVATVRAEGS